MKTGIKMLSLFLKSKTKTGKGWKWNIWTYLIPDTVRLDDSVSGSHPCERFQINMIPIEQRTTSWFKKLYTWWQCVPLCERSHCVRGGVVADEMLGLERKYSKINLSLKVIHKWNVSSGNYKYSVDPSLVAMLKYSIFNTSNVSCKGVFGICQGSAEWLIR